ncbi:uncharacterized protein LOC121871741 [Homarus americanus]|uniref:uncharacterized protein LOC121871741 n=1 Tax=Homarus americanus TaxID=6706 RepID=UPI001C45365C|nr:uncharacterized protein LOC121871741 [Homarus americanus]
MYRKYLQELSDRPSSSSQPRPSPDGTVFPDTHLIVGDAHLKAARAGAVHRELFTNRVDSVPVSLSSTGKSNCCDVNQSVVCKANNHFVTVSQSSIVTSDSHSVSVALSAGVKPDTQNVALIQSSKVTSASEDSGVIRSPSVKNDSHNNSPSPSLAVKSSGHSPVSHSPVVKTSSHSSAISHSSVVEYKRRGRRDPRRYSDTIQLEDFMSRTNTPEFRRRPVDLFVTDTDDAVGTRPRVSPRDIHSPYAGHPSPVQVWDSQSFSDVSLDEVIVSRPVLEASKNKSPLYPAPRGDLISAVLVEKTHYTHVHSQDVIKVKSISQDSQDSEGLTVEDPQTRRENGGLPRPSSKFPRNLQKEVAPWGRGSPGHKPSTQTGEPVQESTTMDCYSVFCCSVNPGSSNNSRR